MLVGCVDLASSDKSQRIQDHGHWPPKGVRQKGYAFKVTFKWLKSDERLRKSDLLVIWQLEPLLADPFWGTVIYTCILHVKRRAHADRSPKVAEYYGHRAAAEVLGATQDQNPRRMPPRDIYICIYI